MFVIRGHHPPWILEPFWHQIIDQVFILIYDLCITFVLYILMCYGLNRCGPLSVRWLSLDPVGPIWRSSLMGCRPCTLGGRLVLHSIETEWLIVYIFLRMRNEINLCVTSNLA